MASRGFIELLRIADLARARKSGRRGGKEFDWQGVVFEIGGQRLVAPMGQVSEILTMPEYTSVPLVKPWMLGIANIRGRLLPLTDLSRFLQVPSQLSQMTMIMCSQGCWSIKSWVLSSSLKINIVQKRLSPARHLRLITMASFLRMSKIGMCLCQACLHKICSIPMPPYKHSGLYYLTVFDKRFLLKQE